MNIEKFTINASSRISESQNLANNLKNPEITDFQCNGRMLRAEVRQEHLLPFATKFLKLESYTNRISVTIVSQYR